MNCPIKRPVKVNMDGAIIDAEGRVVANFCYRNDLDHVRKHMAMALFVADLINNFQEEPSEVVAETPEKVLAGVGEQKTEGNGHGDSKLNGLVTTIASEIIEGSKRRGNPAFQKGKPNPYPKKKDDSQ